MKESIRESMIYGYMIEPINEDVLLEFDIKESIKSIVNRVKKFILKLLEKLEVAINNCKDSQFKSIMLKAVNKLKALLTKADSINSVEDANKISKEVNDIKDELNDESKAMINQAIAENKILRIKIMAKNAVFWNGSDAYISYAKSKGVDIFDDNAKDFTEPEYDKLNKEEATDLFNQYAAEIVDNFSRHNLDILKKLVNYIY